MPSASPAQRWVPAGVALAGILLAALNLRTAVAALSPVLDRVADDLTVSPLLVGLLGSTPPIAFALSGLVAPTLARRFGLEATLVGALGAMALGHLGRAASPDGLVLVLASLLTLGAVGTATVLMPPLVKRYFPEAVGSLTSAYATAMAISTTLPPLVAVPLADAGGWRLSLGIWAAAALLAVPPWLIAVAGHRRELAHLRDAASTGTIDVVAPARLRLGRSPVAWAITALFTVSGFTAYVCFGWLPRILVEIAGVTEAEAGAMLALFAAMGFPAALLVPMLAERLRSVAPLVIAATVFGLAGGLGLLLAPAAAPWLWVALLGLGPLLFPLSMYLIGARARTPESSVALSGFVNRVGYLMAAGGPLLVGALHDLTGDWIAPLVLVTATFLAAVPAALVLRTPLTVDDERAEPDAAGRA